MCHVMRSPFTPSTHTATSAYTNPSGARSPLTPSTHGLHDVLLGHTVLYVVPGVGSGRDDILLGHTVLFRLHRCRSSSRSTGVAYVLRTRLLDSDSIAKIQDQPACLGMSCEI